MSQPYFKKNLMKKSFLSPKYYTPNGHMTQEINIQIQTKTYFGDYFRRFVKYVKDDWYGIKLCMNNMNNTVYTGISCSVVLLWVIY